MSFQPVSQPTSNGAPSSNPWTPGSLKRLPWLGLGAMLGSLAALAACVGILVASNGQPIALWSIQPSVYLAIAVPVVNLLLTFSLSEGADVAWWRKATTSGTTVGDLHRVWSHGKSFTDAVLAGRNTSLVAIACILATIAQINSPLLQRASTVVERGQDISAVVKIRAAQTWPSGWWSGYISGRSLRPTLYTPQFSTVVQEYNTNTSVNLPAGHGCLGICKTQLTGLGIAVNCSKYSMPFDLRPHELSDGTYDAGQDPSINGTDVFYTDIDWHVPVSAITIRTLYKDTHECDGTLNGQTCTILPATVQYPVIINGPANTIQLDPASKVWNDTVIESFDFATNVIQGAKPFAGYYLALMNKYNSSVHMRFTGAVGYTLDATGSTATQYAILDTTVDSQATDAATNCTVAFSNPMADVLAGARELMLRTSLVMPQFNSSFGVQQSLSASQFTSRAVFHSNYFYLAGAVAVTLIAMIVVTCIFKGYSDLGRPVTLSPIETAKAFNAPLLRSSDSNMPIEKLVQEIGAQSIRYGVVTVDEADTGKQTASRLLSPFKESTQYLGVNEVGTVEPGMRLCMADEDMVAEPRPGQTYTGRI